MTLIDTAALLHLVSALEEFAVFRSGADGARIEAPMLTLYG
jgi:hypothetical protein